MFHLRNSTDFESHLRQLKHCWLKFHSTDDYYVGIIDTYQFDHRGLTIVLRKMSKCRELVIDYRFDIPKKEWFPVHHFEIYALYDLNLVEMQDQFSKRNALSDNDTLTFKMENGDELIFTRNPQIQKEIEDILNKAP